MVKYSVKKPFTILVAVIAVLVLGFVTFTKMTMDLLPEMNLPYLMVITTYPGASPERVEGEVTVPMENALGTISGVKNVMSVSAENYGMVQLEFEDGTNMDSAMVKVSSAIDQVSASLPDSVGTPNILEISMDMIATMYVAVEHEGYDIYQLSDYARDELIPYIERAEGVASVTDIGLVDKTVQVELNEDKIDDLNDRILAMASKELDDARDKLLEAQKQVDDGQAMLEAQESSFGQMVSSGIFGALNEPVSQAASSLKGQILNTASQLENLQGQVAGFTSNARQTITSAITDAQTAQATAQAKVEAAKAVAQQAQADYDEAVRILTEAGEEATEEMQQAVALAQQALTDAQSDLAKAQEELAQAVAHAQTAASQVGTAVDTADIEGKLSSLAAQMREVANSIDGSSLSSLMSAVSKLSSLIPQIQNAVSSVTAQLPAGSFSGDSAAISNGITALTGVMDSVPGILGTLQSTFAALTQGQLDAAVGFSTAANQLTGAQAQLKSAMAQYEAARDTALDNANANALLNAAVLSQMIYAQNFSMPAGYIDDENDNSWLLRVGDEFDGTGDIADALLCDIDGIGPVRLTDVADVTVIDNADQSYAKLNGSDAIVLSIYKSAAAGTNAVSRKINETLDELSANDSGVHFVKLMDQGAYISLIISDILRNMLLGAALAIVVLALFLRTVRPTIMVAFSIPLSVLFAVVLMYFSGLTLNIMTLSGLALGIGMLVDNSIVVIENIFRLRLRGLPAPRAAVQGTKQVAGAIASSTLTTVCVFLPMVFTTGTVRSLLIPMALSISFCLLASLAVAMTVVPASASTILKNVNARPGRLMEKVQNAYGRSLRYCLKHKLLSLAVAIGLLVLCLIRLITMGIVMLPKMDGEDIQVTVTTPKEDDRATSYRKVDDVMERLLKIDGVAEVGGIDASSTVGFVTSMGGNSDEYGSYLFYVTPEGNAWEGRMDDLADAIVEAASDIDCTVTASAGGMNDMTALMPSGLTINIYGNNAEAMAKASEDIMAIVETVDGFDNISNGLEEAEQTLHLIIDKDKAMSYGLTVAQIYAEIAQKLTTSVTSTSITLEGRDIDVRIVDKTHKLTRENILDMEFTSSQAGTAGGSAGLAAMMGGSGDMASMTGSSGSDMMGGLAAMGGTSDMSAMMSGFGLGDAGDTGENGSGDSDGSDDSGDAESDSDSSDVHKLGEFATLEETVAPSSITRSNLTRYQSVTASTKEGYNTSLLSRDLKTKLDAYEPPYGVKVEIEGETSVVSDMLVQMMKLLGLALLFIYLVMVAQFQSLLSPFIVMFTIPLAFTGGMLGLIIAREQLSMLSLMGFLILVGTVVNNGIVFVDYANQLRMGGMERRDALVATGRTRMRPILMTALTTILAMVNLIFRNDMGSQMSRGMAIVIVGGLLYATLMTLYIVPVIYDLLFRRQPLVVDVGDDIDDAPDDAAEFLEMMRRSEETSAEADEP